MGYSLISILTFIPRERLWRLERGTQESTAQSEKEVEDRVSRKVSRDCFPASGCALCT